MAKKSKTQRAKASAARAARKEAKQIEAARIAAEQSAIEKPEEAENPKGFALIKQKFLAFFKSQKKDKQEETAIKKTKAAKKPKKKHFIFLREVRSELKKVKWPARDEVVRWSAVVVVSLLFFGIYVAILDNAIVTPLLVLISGLGA